MTLKVTHQVYVTPSSDFLIAVALIGWAAELPIGNCITEVVLARNLVD